MRRVLSTKSRASGTHLQAASIFNDAELQVVARLFNASGLIIANRGRPELRKWLGEGQGDGLNLPRFRASSQARGKKRMLVPARTRAGKRKAELGKSRRKTHVSPGALRACLVSLSSQPFFLSLAHLSLSLARSARKKRHLVQTITPVRGCHRPSAAR